MIPRPHPSENFEQNVPLIEIATRNVVCLTPEDTVGKAAKVMAEKRISSIIVTDDGQHPLGIVTERNMLHAMQSGFPPEVPLRKVMSAPVITVAESTSCFDAYQMCLRRGIRHLVIVDQAALLLGVVSETDFRLHFNLTVLAGRRKVMSVAKRTAIILPSSTSLIQALDLMQAQRKSCVVAVDDGKPVGIITERDVVRLYSGDKTYVDYLLGEIMVSPVLTISQDATTNQAAEKMLNHKVRHLVVVDEAERCVGLLSEHDLTQVMMIGLEEEREGSGENFFRTLVNTLPDLVWLKNAEGVYLACNERFEHFLGIKKLDILGRTDYDLVDKVQADAFREHDRKTMATGKPSVNEEWLTFMDNGYHGLFETIKTPMRNRSGELIGVLGIARDITERKQIEDALRFIAQRGNATNPLRTLKDIAQYLGKELGVDYVIIDRLTEDVSIAETVALYAKGSLVPNMRYALKGTPCENVMGKCLCCYTQDVQSLFPEDSLLVDMGVESYAGIPLWDSSGLTIGLIAVMDSKPFTNVATITSLLQLMTARASAELEREHSDQLLRMREREFRTLAENAPMHIARYDRDCRMVYVNPRLTQALDMTADMMIGTTPSEHRPGSFDAYEATVRQVMADENEARTELTYRDKAHGLHCQSIYIVPEYDEKGEVTGALAMSSDITERKHAEDELKLANVKLAHKAVELLREKEKFELLMQTSGDGIHIVDALGNVVEVNDKFCEMLGYGRDELLGMPASKWEAKYSPEEIKAKLAENLRVENVFETRHRRKNGTTIDVEVSAKFIVYDGQTVVWNASRDITERRRAEEDLRVTASVFDTTQDAIVITDTNNIITDINPAFTRITGYGREEVLGKNPKILSSGRQGKEFYTAMWDTLKEKKAWRGEIWNRRKCGEIYAELLSVSMICDAQGRVQRHVGVFSDISYLKEHEAELTRVANYDALTGIPNRRLLADRLRQAIVHAQRSNKMLAICYIDLDGFKDVNDLLGHEAGDQLLVGVSRHIQEALRAGDTLARLGGDEFVVLFNDLSQDNECLQVLERIMQSIATPMQINLHPVAISASIGVTFYPSDDKDGDTLLRHADQAMYIAKQTGKNRYHLYDPVHDQQVRSMHESRKRILQGLENNEFELHYQPKVELASGKVIGVEALIRWHHPEQGLLYPAEFLPFIEASDLEIHLGEWVIAAALTQLAEWCKQGQILEMSINISARHLQSPDFATKLAQNLNRHPEIPRDQLQIEVLETAALEDMPHSAETIEACRKLGVSFALDDFGTGYSSLAYLRKLSAETLKIDQTFVQGMLTSEGDRAIVQGIIALAKTFGRKTVAEGMEAAELTQILIEIGCMYGQGYGIARPMPADDFFKWHTERR